MSVEFDVGFVTCEAGGGREGLCSYLEVAANEPFGQLLNVRNVDRGIVCVVSALKQAKTGMHKCCHSISDLDIYYNVIIIIIIIIIGRILPPWTIFQRFNSEFL